MKMYVFLVNVYGYHMETNETCKGPDAIKLVCFHLHSNMLCFLCFISHGCLGKVVHPGRK